MSLNAAIYHEEVNNDHAILQFPELWSLFNSQIFNLDNLASKLFSEGKITEGLLLVSPSLSAIDKVHETLETILSSLANFSNTISQQNSKSKPILEKLSSYFIAKSLPENIKNMLDPGKLVELTISGGLHQAMASGNLIELMQKDSSGYLRLSSSSTFSTSTDTDSEDSIAIRSLKSSSFYKKSNPYIKEDKLLELYFFFDILKDIYNLMNIEDRFLNAVLHKHRLDSFSTEEVDIIKARLETKKNDLLRNKEFEMLLSEALGFDIAETIRLASTIIETSKSESDKKSKLETFTAYLNAKFKFNLLPNDLPCLFEATEELLIRSHLSAELPKQHEVSSIDVYIEKYCNLLTKNTGIKYLYVFAAYLKDKSINYDPISLANKIISTYDEILLAEFEMELAIQGDLYRKDIYNMSGSEFEDFLKQLFEKLDFSVELTPINDQGADLIITKDGKKTCVQAKRYSGAVGNAAVQEVTASLKHYSASNGMVISTGYFTQSAKALADSNGIELVDLNALKKLIAKATAK